MPRQACQLALAESNVAVAADLEKQIAAYESGQPFRRGAASATPTSGTEGVTR